MRLGSRPRGWPPTRLRFDNFGGRGSAWTGRAAELVISAHEDVRRRCLLARCVASRCRPLPRTGVGSAGRLRLRSGIQLKQLWTPTRLLNRRKRDILRPQCLVRLRGGALDTVGGRLGDRHTGRSLARGRAWRLASRSSLEVTPRGFRYSTTTAHAERLSSTVELTSEGGALCRTASIDDTAGW